MYEWQQGAEPSSAALGLNRRVMSTSIWYSVRIHERTLSCRFASWRSHVKCSFLAIVLIKYFKKSPIRVECTVHDPFPRSCGYGLALVWRQQLMGRQRTGLSNCSKFQRMTLEDYSTFVSSKITACKWFILCFLPVFPPMSNLLFWYNKGSAIRNESMLMSRLVYSY